MIYLVGGVWLWLVFLAARSTRKAWQFVLGFSGLLIGFGLLTAVMFLLVGIGSATNGGQNGEGTLKIFIGFGIASVLCYVPVALYKLDQEEKKEK